MSFESEKTDVEKRLSTSISTYCAADALHWSQVLLNLELIELVRDARLGRIEAVIGEDSNGRAVVRLV